MKKAVVWVVLLLFVLVVVLGACAPASTGQSGSQASGQSPTAQESQRPSDDVTQLPRLVDNAAWVTREGETALVISPSQLLRDSSGEEVYDEAWRRVVVAIPKADTPGMRDQFVCHAQFASTKDAWYLEPARPAVGYWRTVSAGCNPGDVTDVG
ncbi:hypothetical protein BJY21_003529 [Kineosphaera limosa]|uniref:DUF2599 domain-containing protein n=1 Tax=Kineosphaera limosa TaxID=111564 RepID=UPI00030A1049|nr:DUF2599 domain-containing protein [Kineosphaera limosa]NYE02345.1 hypothetical protein [Kineosphaera limosa]